MKKRTIQTRAGRKPRPLLRHLLDDCRAIKRAVATRPAIGLRMERGGA